MSSARKRPRDRSGSPRDYNLAEALHEINARLDRLEGHERKRGHFRTRPRSPSPSSVSVSASEDSAFEGFPGNSLFSLVKFSVNNVCSCLALLLSQMCVRLRRVI